MSSLVEEIVIFINQMDETSLCIPDPVVDIGDTVVKTTPR